MAKAVIIGPGNIGTDLLYKALRSEHIEVVWSIGVVESSDGLRIAREHGVKTSHQGLEAVLDEVIADGVTIAFDATSAKYHPRHNELLTARGVRMIDLTPAAIGPYCIPPVNLEEHVDAPNVNMVTCGGQATIPMVAAVSRVQTVKYGEIVATVSSRSIGPGTRSNIDEFTRTTRAGIEAVGGARTGKAIIVINPAEPPIIMRDTIHCLTEDEPDQEAITASIHDMVREVQTYVPGYTLKNGPVFDGHRVTVWMEVEGLGDYLPKYAGNLDIMTSAALKTAELLAMRGLA
ncbi:MAG: acetaldehyde dehydrogenase (acetylating) [Deltaproteobacteria bacterium]|nr:MAG: acetaldehyde dehydrogenase (acetylating) [Deltaproteobacteria bacterium]